MFDSIGFSIFLAPGRSGRPVGDSSRTHHGLRKDARNHRPVELRERMIGCDKLGARSVRMLWGARQKKWTKNLNTTVVWKSQ
jgi:hypothetical protein